MQVGSTFKAVIDRVDEKQQRIALTMRLAPEMCQSQVSLAERRLCRVVWSCHTRGRRTVSVQGGVVEGNIPEAETVCAALAQQGLDAVLGPHTVSIAFVPLLQASCSSPLKNSLGALETGAGLSSTSHPQVFLSNSAAAAQDRRLRIYSAVVRLGYDVQEITITSALDRQAVRAIAADTVKQSGLAGD